MAYDHKSIEPRWQEYWATHQTFKAERREGHPKYYVLDMFPYPSGTGLHVGHPEGYTASDIVARYKRMNVFDVLHPMGWDAFGLPAEQHAIDTGTPPASTTVRNIATFKRQLKSLGFAYDWSREINTTDPGYFRWTQWIFLQLFRRGLAFQAEIPVNWCPDLGTVLANEEVIDGRSERGNFPVVRQPLRQWQLRITAYADRLASELEPLDWPETRQKQRDWIGRSEGAEVDFPLVGRSEKLTVYTTRPDTLFGATYMVIAPDHPLTVSIAGDEQRAAVTVYVQAAARKSDMERTALNKEKTGIFVGAYATNPLTGGQIPIYTADYVLGAYGTGAIMAVPGHDERDFEFAKKFELPIVQVVSKDGTLSDSVEQPFSDDGVAVRSGRFDGQPTSQVKANVIAFLEADGIGRRRVNYKLRDWVFSRQRYWGEPIPIYFPVQTAGDPRRGDLYEIDYKTPIPVDDSELPLLLPQLDDYRPGDPQGPLVRATDWRFFQKEGQWFARETNTMPQWAGSCWYYLRFLDPKNELELVSRAAYDDWMPVDLYVGGAEHAVLHLLYARFWHKVLFDMGLVSTKEPLQKLRDQETVLASSYEDSLGRYHEPSEIEFRGETAILRATGETLKATVEKMAKSKMNGVNPDDVIRDYGADVMRLYELFMGEFELPKPWDPRAIEGVNRFLKRVWRLCEEWDAARAPAGDPHLRLRHKTIRRVTADLERMQFNTAISALMEYVNEMVSGGATREDLLTLIKLVGPYAPHLGDEAWERIGERGFLLEAAWPTFDEALTIDAQVTVGVQVDGKLRGSVELPRDASEADARAAALAIPNVAKHLEGRAIKKFIYKAGRIIGIVTGPAA